MRPPLATVMRGDLISQRLDPITNPSWQAFVATCDDASVFHTTSWLELLQAQYGYRISAQVIFDRTGHLVAGIPFAQIKSRMTGERMVALPFSDVCPPLARSTAALDALAGSLQELHEREGLDVEVRGSVGSLPLDSRRFYQHQLSLDPEVGSVEARFSTMVRRGIARARRDGVEVRLGTDAADLNAFYRLHVRTRQRQGVPSQPKRFITRFSELFDKDLGFVLSASVDGELAAAAVFLSYNGVLTYKYGASRRELLKARPNHAVLMEAVRWGCDRGYRVFDLGRTDLDNNGLREFKRGWGTDERRLSYASLSQRSDRSARVPGLAKRFISRTPSFTGRLVGAALYRHYG